MLHGGQRLFCWSWVMGEGYPGQQVGKNTGIDATDSGTGEGVKK